MSWYALFHWMAGTLSLQTCRRGIAEPYDAPAVHPEIPLHCGGNKILAGHLLIYMSNLILGSTSTRTTTASPVGNPWRSELLPRTILMLLSVLLRLLLAVRLAALSPSGSC